jgi:hypothetical protein
LRRFRPSARVGSAKPVPGSAGSKADAARNGAGWLPAAHRQSSPKVRTRAPHGARISAGECGCPPARPSQPGSPGPYRPLGILDYRAVSSVARDPSEGACCSLKWQWQANGHRMGRPPACPLKPPGPTRTPQPQISYDRGWRMVSLIDGIFFRRRRSPPACARQATERIDNRDADRITWLPPKPKAHRLRFASICMRHAALSQPRTLPAPFASTGTRILRGVGGGILSGGSPDALSARRSKIRPARALRRWPAELGDASGNPESEGAARPSPDRGNRLRASRKTTAPGR